MKQACKSRWKTWLMIALVSLGLHYLMLMLASVFLSGGLSFRHMGQLLLDRWTRPGDAARYLDIAAHGYVTEGENAINLVFYPLYPLLMRLVGAVTGLEAAGLLISQVSYAGASILLYEYLLLDGDARAAWDGVLLLALYPFSMFAMGIYSEGLFLLLTVGCLYALRRGRFIAAGIVGFFAALTRTQGMLLIFPAVYELVSRRFGLEKRRFRWGDLVPQLRPAWQFHAIPDLRGRRALVADHQMDRRQHRPAVGHGPRIPGAGLDHLLAPDHPVFRGAGGAGAGAFPAGENVAFAVRRGVPGVYVPVRLDDQRRAVSAVLRAAVRDPGEGQGRFCQAVCHSFVRFAIFLLQLLFPGGPRHHVVDSVS